MKFAPIERKLARLEGAIEALPSRRRWLRVIVEGDEPEAKAKALAAHLATYPEDAGRSVEDFNWTRRTIHRRVSEA